MKLTAGEIAVAAEGVLLDGDPGIAITGANGLLEAGPEDISFLGNPRYAGQVAKSRAGVIFFPSAMPLPGRAVITVKNPQLAFAMILRIIEGERKVAPSGQIHPAAVIAPSARLGASVTIGACAVIEECAVIGDGTCIMPHVYVGRNTVIGNGCMLYPGVMVRENVSLGNRVIVHSGAVIGSDGFGFVPSGNGIFKIPQIGGVEIDDDVEIGANVTIDRATTGMTRVGRATKIDNLVQIAHNVQIGSHCMIVAQVGISGSTIIGNGVIMAGQSGTAGHLEIGDGVIVAARAGVTSDIQAKETVSGFPARPHRDDLKTQALLRKLPQIYNDIKQLRSKKTTG